MLVEKDDYLRRWWWPTGPRLAALVSVIALTTVAFVLRNAATTIAPTPANPVSTQRIEIGREDSANTSKAEETPEFTGHYANGYGFRVTIPVGYVGLRNSPTGFSDHGVVIPLSKPPYEPGRHIEAFACYNAMLYASVQAALDAGLNSLRAQPHFTVHRKYTYWLAGLRARRAVVQYEERDRTMVVDRLDVLRPGRRNTDVDYAYSVTLCTSAEHYDEDSAILAAFLNSWHFTMPTYD